MTLKAISQFYYLNNEIIDLQNKISALEDKATDTSVKISGMPRGSGTGDKVGQISSQLADYKSELILRLEECQTALRNVGAYISACPDSLTRQILTLRFVDGLPWGQVAAAIGGTSEYSVKHIAYRYLKKN